MPYLYDNEQGKAVEVPADQVTNSIGSGRFTFVQGKQSSGDIPVRAPDGTPGMIPAAHAKRLFDKGYTYETEGQAKERVVAEEAKDFGPLATGAVSALDMFTGGVPLAGALGQTDRTGALRDFIKATRKEYKGAHVVGSVLGALGPGGAGSLMAKGGGALARGLGGYAAKGAARTVLARGAGGAVEGGLAGYQQFATEDALGNIDPEYYAESLLATVRTGALLGFGMGAAGGGIAAGLASKAAKKAEGVAAKAAIGASDEVAIGGAKLRVGPDGKVLAAAGPDVAASAAKAAGEIVEEAPKAGAAQRTARWAASQALGVKRKTLNSFTRRFGSAKKGKKKLQDSLDIISDAPHPDGKPIIKAARSVEQVSERLDEAVQFHGKRIGGTMRSADEITTTQALPDEQLISGKTIADKLRKAAREREFSSPGNKAGKKRLLEAADDLEQIGKISFDDAMFHRGVYGKRAYDRDVVAGDVFSALRKIERTIAKEADDKLVPLLKKHAPGSLERYEESRIFYAASADIADKTSQQAFRSAYSNNLFSLTSKIGGAAMAAGRAGDVGVLGAAAGGTMTGMAIEFAKRRGASTLYAMTDKMTRLRGITKAAEKTDGAIKRSIKSALSRTPSRLAKLQKTTRVAAQVGLRAGRGATKEATRLAAIKASEEGLATRRVAAPYIPAAVKALQSSGVFRAPSKKDESPQAAAKRWSDELAKITTSPERIADVVASQTAGVEFASPKVAAQTAALLTKRLQYLQEHAPKQPPSGNLLMPVNPDWEPTREATAEFARRVAAARDPMSVFRDLENGTITKEAVETLRELYPQVYEKAKMEVVGQVAENPAAVPYDSKIRLSVLFDTPLDATLTPNFIRASQQAFAPAPVAGQGGGGMRVTGLDKLNLGERAQSAAQSMEAQK